MKPLSKAAKAEAVRSFTKAIMTGGTKAFLFAVKFGSDGTVVMRSGNMKGLRARVLEAFKKEPS